MLAILDFTSNAAVGRPSLMSMRDMQRGSMLRRKEPSVEWLSRVSFVSPLHPRS